MFYSKNPIEREKDTLKKMVALYCRGKHKNKSLCHDCQELIAYANFRLDHCKFGGAKPTCEKCPIHCYKPTMRQRVRDVMRFAGPRMIIYHPVDAVRHIIKNVANR